MVGLFLLVAVTGVSTVALISRSCKLIEDRWATLVGLSLAVAAGIYIVDVGTAEVLLSSVALLSLFATLLLFLLVAVTGVSTVALISRSCKLIEDRWATLVGLSLAVAAGIYIVDVGTAEVLLSSVALLSLFATLLLTRLIALLSLLSLFALLAVLLSLLAISIVACRRVIDWG